MGHAAAGAPPAPVAKRIALAAGIGNFMLYVEEMREIGVPPLNAPGRMASFGLANSLGYADQISNRVVDAIGDVSGGVRLYDPQEDPR